MTGISWLARNTANGSFFRRMRRSEQQHSINVLRMLQARGYSDSALMVAALLHDVGKTRAAYHLWDRVLAAAEWGGHSSGPPP